MHSASFSWRDYSGYGFWWDHLRGTIVLLCHIHSSIVKYSNLCATTYSVKLFTSQNTLSCLFYVGSLNPRDNVRLTNNCNKPGVRAWSKIILLISVGWQTNFFCICHWINLHSYYVSSSSSKCKKSYCLPDGLDTNIWALITCTVVIQGKRSVKLFSYYNNENCSWVYTTYIVHVHVYIILQ